MRTQCASVTAICGLLVVAACGGGGGGTQPGPTAKTIAVNGGDNQVAPAGTALAPLSVVVKDSTGAGVQGITVNWAAASGGGSVSAAASVSDANGVASITRTLSANAGTHTTTATRAGLTGSPVTFTAVAQIQGATQMAISAGNNQTDTVLATLGTALSVLVRDQNNTPVTGVVVNWSATGDTASAATSTTNGSGIASITLKQGPTAGVRTAQATVAGLAGSPVSFSHTATAGDATLLQKTAGDGGTAAPSAMVSHTVTTRDSHNNLKSGTVIDWAVTSGGGSITPLQNTTGSNGQATATHTLGGSTGANTATATANGITGAPSVTFTTTAALVASVTVGSGGNNFNPQNLTVANGTIVTWTFVTGIHNLTWISGPPGSTNTINPMPANSTYQFTFTTNGTFTYQCTNHINMTGQVTVQ